MLKKKVRIMSALETYLTAVRDSKGIEHMTAVNSLRWYIRTTAETDMVSAIRAIKDIGLLKHLIEAGLKPTLQRVTLLHYDRLKEAGGE